MAGHDVPTCYVSVEVVIQDESGSSRWVPCAQFADMPEYAYCRDEVLQLLESYGQFCATYGMARRTEYANIVRYRVRIRGAFTGRQTAMQEWHWVGRRGIGVWVPDGEPLLTWPHWRDVPAERREEFGRHILLEDSPPGFRPPGKKHCGNCPKGRLSA